MATVMLEATAPTERAAVMERPTRVERLKQHLLRVGFCRVTMDLLKEAEMRAELEASQRRGIGVCAHCGDPYETFPGEDTDRCSKCAPMDVRAWEIRKRAITKQLKKEQAKRWGPTRDG